MAACPRTSMCTVGGDSSCARAPHLVTRAGEVIESEGTPPSAPPVPDKVHRWRKQVHRVVTQVYRVRKPPSQVVAAGATVVIAGRATRRAASPSRNACVALRDAGSATRTASRAEQSAEPEITERGHTYRRCLRTEVLPVSPAVQAAHHTSLPLRVAAARVEERHSYCQDKLMS